MQTKLNYLYLSLILVAGAALCFVYRSYRFRLKAAQHEKELIKKEKDDLVLLAQMRENEKKQIELKKSEAELHARLQEEETMRLLVEQQLLQIRQESLQKDLLISSLQVEHKDGLLQAVQSKIKEDNINGSTLKQINRIIDQDKKEDQSFTINKTYMENIHPEFFERLKKQSNNTLSKLDYKHCAYIYLGLTNKEMAARLGVAPKSILMSRYRIKQKLNLDKDVDLDDYIKLAVG
jgi:hypothetical protein